MDTSKRFQIQQPTGGEAVEFLRLVELQAAASQAGGILAHFASVLGDQENKPEWQRLQKEYAEKTQQLWKGDWFRDFDARASKLVESADRDPSQAAPAFCGIATDEQNKAMLSTLRAMYERMQKNRDRPESSVDEALNWSSFVLPFVESAYAAGDRPLASATVQAICERIYNGMDRRSLQNSDAPQAPLGWPGTSCEVWGAHGAFGGEVYGWGAVMPAHIIRNLLGFRETEEADQFVLSPGFGPGLAVSGKRYALDGLPYAGKSLGVGYAFSNEKQLNAELRLPAEARLVYVTDADGKAMKFSRKGNLWEISIENYGQYHVKVEGLAVNPRPQAVAGKKCGASAVERGVHRAHGRRAGARKAREKERGADEKRGRRRGAPRAAGRGHGGTRDSAAAGKRAAGAKAGRPTRHANRRAAPNAETRRTPTTPTGGQEHTA